MHCASSTVQNIKSVERFAMSYVGCRVSNKWAWSRSRDPVSFWAFNANSSKMAKVTNF